MEEQHLPYVLLGYPWVKESRIYPKWFSYIRSFILPIVFAACLWVKEGRNFPKWFPVCRLVPENVHTSPKVNGNPKGGGVRVRKANVLKEKYGAISVSEGVSTNQNNLPWRRGVVWIFSKSFIDSRCNYRYLFDRQKQLNFMASKTRAEKMSALVISG